MGLLFEVVIRKMRRWPEKLDRIRINMKAFRIMAEIRFFEMPIGKTVKDIKVGFKERNWLVHHLFLAIYLISPLHI